MAIVWVVAVALLAVPVGAGAQDRPWYDDPAVEQRVEAIVEQMTLEQKVDLATGKIIAGFGFSNNAMSELGIPTLGAFDGPVGVRVGGGSSGSPSGPPLGRRTTLLPSGTSLASTFDEQRGFEFGRVMGVEAHKSGGNMMLAPTVDTLRSPFNPRAWETFSEDPLLTGRMGAADTNGIQSVPGVGAALKHYALNTQEERRQTINAVVDERTLQELYMSPFEKVVREAHPASIMCAFTSVNGVDSCSSEELLTKILKGQLGFKGFVQTDYQANQQTVESANAGTDLDMPGVNENEDPIANSSLTVWGAKLLQAVQNGQVDEAKLDEMSRRILRGMIGVGMFDHPPTVEDLPIEEHGQIARQISAEGTVLLKNKRKVLPLAGKRMKSIAVIGTGTNFAWRGGGSGNVSPAYDVSPLQGIQERADAEGIDVRTAPGVDPIGGATLVTDVPPVPSSFFAPPGGQPGEGLRAEYYQSSDLSGSPLATLTDPIPARAGGFYTFFPAPGESPAPFSASLRWTGTLTAPQTGRYRFALTAFGSARVWLDGEQVGSVGPTPRLGTPSVQYIDLRLREGESHDFRLEYLSNSPEHQDQFGFLYGLQVSFGWVHDARSVQPSIQQAAQVADDADVAVVFARTYESEGFIDRPSLRLPNDQGQLIREVAKRNRNTIVVLQTGGAVVTTDWDRSVPAILENWFGGEEQGHAIADVLWGDVNPSGSLPITFPRSDRQTPITFRGDEEQYPGLNDRSVYREGVFIGYRGHEEFNLSPRWPFGHGLSYSANFGFSRLQTPSAPRDPESDEVQVSFTLRNRGRRRGTEIAQVYVGRLPTRAVKTPKRVLAGWAKATLDPGESRRVTATLDRRAFQYWDVDADRWVTPSGPVRIMVGRSVENIALRGAVRIGS